MMKYVLLSLFACVVLTTQAQQNDTNQVVDRPIQTLQFSAVDFENDLDKGLAVDTTLRPVLMGTPTLPPYSFSAGNVGDPGGLLWWLADHEVGFNPGLTVLDQHRISKDSVRYFSTNQPFSRITFTNGSKQEVGLLGQHTQNINESWNIGVNYDRTSGEGFFTRQKSRHANLVVTSNYVAPGNRYRVLAHYYYSRSLVEENGGISSQESFEENGGSFSGNGLVVVPAFLSNAQNDVRYNRVLVKQMFRFGQKESTTNPGDTIETFNFRPRVQVFHEFWAEEREMFYRDEAPDSAFYAPNLPSYITSLDSVINFARSVTYNNRFGIQNGVSTKANVPFEYEVFGRHQSIRFLQSANRLNGDNLFLGGAIALRVGQFALKSKGESAVGGFNAGDFTFRTTMGRNTLKQDSGKKAWDYQAFLQVVRERPQYTQERFGSADFGWENDFNKESRAQLGVSVRQTAWKLQLGAKFTQLDNLVYFDSLAQAQQLGEGVSLIQFHLNKQFRAGHFYFNPGVRYQLFSNDDVFPMPAFLTYTTAYYQGNWFKNALTAQIGVDVYYTSAFKRPGYHPLYRNFYNQSQEIDGYPFIDAYLAVRIKKVRAFLKAQHANAGLMGTDYVLVQNNPMPFRTLRFGLDWIFLN